MIRKGDKVKFFNTGKEYDADEIGVLKMDMIPRAELRTGDVGYIISGHQDLARGEGGDTITHIARPCEKAIAGFEEVKPMVFAGVYPIEAEDYENLRASLEKLQLNDASPTFQPESHWLWDSDSVAVFWDCFTWRLFRNVWTASLI